MKKILLLLAAIICAVLITAASLLGSALVSINALSIVPFALCFVMGVAGIGDVRFKDDEDDKLTKDECSLPIKEVARIRHSKGLACLIGCLPEIFLVFFVDGALKIIFAFLALILFFALAWQVYAAEMKKVLKNQK